MKRLIRDAFAELEEESVHPSPEEIAAAVESTSSGFAMTEIRGHLGWCARCRELAGDFEQFRPSSGPSDPEIENQAWHRLKQGMPARNRVWQPHWLSAAAGFVLCALPFSYWVVTEQKRSPQPPVPVIVQPKPQPVANAGIVDLFPLAGGVRSGQTPAGAALPDPLPDLVTVILHPSNPPSKVWVRIIGQGGELGRSELSRQSGGVFTLALPKQILESRPLTVELGDPDRPIAKFLVP